jgi:hypothetical protein
MYPYVGVGESSTSIYLYCTTSLDARPPSSHTHGPPSLLLVYYRRNAKEVVRGCARPVI